MFGVNMGMLFRMCAILIVFDKFTESKYISHLEKVRCRRIIDKDLKNKNMVLNGGNVDGNSVRFKCNDGLMSNVPNLQDISFDCKFQTELGMVEWKGQGVGVETKGIRTPLYLNNIACVSGCSRYDYSKFPDNMEAKSTRTTKLNVRNRDGPVDLNTYYLPGDTIALECKDGYIHEGVAKQSSENDKADYLDYPTYEGLEIDLTTSLQCGENGMWNNGTEANFGICRAITCDAQSYQKIRAGVITNYKYVYTYSEVLTLQCDQGFRPVNNRNNIQCLTDKSFEIKDLKCEAITCWTPPEPLHGTLETTMMVFLPNATAEFKCDHGYTMVGSPVWECQPDGEWNESCIQCVREDDFCQPPCVPVGSRIVDIPRRIEIGTTIEFACDQKIYGGSTNRTCLFNRQWSDEPIDCTGWSLFTPNTGIYLKEALQKSLVNAAIRTTISNEASDDKDQERTINVNIIFGVDVYILIDVSKSIEGKELDLMKKFVIALVKNLEVSNDRDKTDGTKVAVYLFATSMKAFFTQRHSFTEDQIITAINEIDIELILNFQQKKGGNGTAISAALDDVYLDIRTKMMMPGARDAQQVVILISDGNYTQKGRKWERGKESYVQFVKRREEERKKESPVPFATRLKDDYKVELYSIFVGKKEDTTAYYVMKEMASTIGTEQHFFAIDINKNMEEIINAMIAKAPVLPCGGVNTILTKTKAINQSTYSLAEKYAWPWMVQLRYASEVACGGTLINSQWILTAAHCFNESQQNRILTVELKTWKTDASDDGKRSFAIKYRSPTTNDEKNEDVYIHPEYKNPVTKARNFTYDIALIQLPHNVALDSDLNPVCLWGNNNTTDDIKDFSYSSLFKHQTYGVVTGWGYKNTKKDREVQMKQLQFPIQNFNTCRSHIPKDDKTHLSEEYMFCAGTTGNDNIIDACTGDSGGPFVIPHPRNDKQYIQIGIVSFGIGNKCKEEPYRRYYTKLNEDLLGWINKIVKKYSREILPDINECSPNPCLNGATCTDGINAYTCGCVAGWNGKNCDQNINECSPNPCQNGATCTDGINAYTCDCVAGWNGKNCDQNVNECASNPCQNGATCNNLQNKYTCTCAGGWHGVNCELGCDGLPFRFLNSLDIAPDGGIYFTDSTFKWQRRDFRYAVLETRPDGRLLHYDPTTGVCRTVLSGLYLANGLTLSHDKTYVLVNEMSVARIRRYYLSGKKKGTSDVFVDNLPGFPDNIKPNSRGNYYVGMGSVRFKGSSPLGSFLDLIAPYPILKKFIAAITPLQAYNAFMPKHALAVEIDDSGTIVNSLHDPGAKSIAAVSELFEFNNTLYIGHFQSPYLGVLHLKDLNERRGAYDET